MKIATTNRTSALCRWVRFFGVTLFMGLTVVCLLVPAAVLSQSSPAPVNLRTAGNFAILAKTGISATGVTSIKGDIGVSPVAATYLTGFGLIMDASGRFSTSSLVVGNAYASDYIVPTPTKMTTAVGDMETAYTDAAGRATPDYTELYSGDLTGKTLTRGLYKWGTGVLISAGGVTISGSATDVWIFQIAQNLDLGGGAMVNLIGGAQAANIFWQVAGQATLGTTASMQGIILCKTTIVMRTGSSLSGGALAQAAVTLDATTITGPPSGPTSVGDIEIGLSPQAFALAQNFPNPFNPVTTIDYQLPASGRVKLSVFDVIGRKVGLLVDEWQKAGSYKIEWNAVNYPSGVYYYRLNAGAFVSMKRMVLIK